MGQGTPHEHQRQGFDILSQINKQKPSFGKLRAAFALHTQPEQLREGPNYVTFDPWGLHGGEAECWCSPSPVVAAACAGVPVAGRKHEDGLAFGLGPMLGAALVQVIVGKGQKALRCSFCLPKWAGLDHEKDRVKSLHFMGN